MRQAALILFLLSSQSAVGVQRLSASLIPPLYTRTLRYPPDGQIRSCVRDVRAELQRSIVGNAPLPANKAGSV